MKEHALRVVLTIAKQSRCNIAVCINYFNRRKATEVNQVRHYCDAECFPFYARAILAGIRDVRNVQVQISPWVMAAKCVCGQQQGHNIVACLQRCGHPDTLYGVRNSPAADVDIYLYLTTRELANSYVGSNARYTVLDHTTSTMVQMPSLPSLMRCSIKFSCLVRRADNLARISSSKYFSVTPTPIITIHTQATTAITILPGLTGQPKTIASGA
ncbi:hypothetical protein D3C73_1072520 [compost metagenome]